MKAVCHCTNASLLKWWSPRVGLGHNMGNCLYMCLYRKNWARKAEIYMKALWHSTKASLLNWRNNKRRQNRKSSKKISYLLSNEKWRYTPSFLLVLHTVKETGDRLAVLLWNATSSKAQKWDTLKKGNNREEKTINDWLFTVLGPTQEFSTYI